MTFPTSLERDIQNCRARRQKQPGRTVQAKTPLMRSGSFAEDLQHQPMKLPAGKTGGPGHCLDRKRILGRTETAAQPAGGVFVPESCPCS